MTIQSDSFQTRKRMITVPIGGDVAGIVISPEESEGAILPPRGKDLGANGGRSRCGVGREYSDDLGKTGGREGAG